MLDIAIGESLEQAKFSLDRGVYNLTIRRSQEAVELSMTKILLEMGVEAPKDHDKGATLFESLSSQGVYSDPSVESKIKEIAISLTRMRGHCMHQTVGYGKSVAQEALSQATYVKEFTENFSPFSYNAALRPRVLTICGSMCKLFEMRIAQERLARVPNWMVIIPEVCSGEYEEKIRTGEYCDTAEIKQKFDSIKRHHDAVARANWVLIYNSTKEGNQGYIGANTFWEIGFAHVSGKPIYMLNDYTNNSFMLEELNAVQAIVLDGDLNKMVNYMEEENKKIFPRL